MSVEHETIEDIIREKRGIAAKIRENLSIVPVRREDQLLVADSLEREADRLEAALKSEAATAEKSSVVGNSAAMREALDEILEQIDNWRTKGIMEHWQYSQLFDIADAAIATPARNCDKYLDKNCAREQYNMQSDTLDPFEWLYRQEKKGGEE